MIDKIVESFEKEDTRVQSDLMIKMKPLNWRVYKFKKCRHITSQMFSQVEEGWMVHRNFLDTRRE